MSFVTELFVQICIYVTVVAHYSNFKVLPCYVNTMNKLQVHVITFVTVT